VRRGEFRVGLVGELSFVPPSSPPKPHRYEPDTRVMLLGRRGIVVDDVHRRLEVPGARCCFGTGIEVVWSSSPGHWL